MSDFQIRGAEQLESVARSLKAAGDGELRKELLRGIRSVGKPVVDDVRKSALAKLPKKGGLNEVVAKTKFATRSRVSGKNVGVSFIGKNEHDTEAIDKGIVRHPVYGSKRWVTQHVAPGWFSEPMENAAPQFRNGIEKVLNEIAAKVERSA